MSTNGNGRKCGRPRVINDDKAGRNFAILSAGACLNDAAGIVRNESGRWEPEAYCALQEP
jgi:hypothetical protein